MKLKFITLTAAIAAFIGCSAPTPQDSDILLCEGWSIFPESSTEYSGKELTTTAVCQPGYIADIPCTSNIEPATRMVPTFSYLQGR